MTLPKLDTFVTYFQKSLDLPSKITTFGEAGTGRVESGAEGRVAGGGGVGGMWGRSGEGAVREWWGE